MVSVPLNKITTVMGGASGFTTKFEEYPVSNEDGSRNVFGSNWMAMLIKATPGYTLNGLKLPLFKTGDPGDITISIQKLSGGDPDGTDVSVATLSDSRLGTTDPPTTLVDITMPAVVLAADEEFAIVIRATGGSAGNTVNWNTDDSSPTYADGNREDSANSGATWTAQTGTDMCFETWGFA